MYSCGLPWQVTALTLDANVTEFAAKSVFQRLPQQNSTAVEMVLQVWLSSAPEFPLSVQQRAAGAMWPAVLHDSFYKHATMVSALPCSCVRFPALTRYVQSPALTRFPAAKAAESAPMCLLQLVGQDIVPFTEAKQTLVLYTIQQLLPRLFNGIGARFARMTAVSQSLVSQTVNITMIMSTSSVPEYFEQVGTTILL